MSSSNSVRVVAAAFGLLLTLTVVLVTVTLVSVNAAPPTSQPFQADMSSSQLLNRFSVLNKGIYVLYGNGRRSERDLPQCRSPNEACNIAHRRFWLTPITERLCRCADRSECPITFTDLNDTLSQHVSNRAQLKFCGPILEDLEVCKKGQVALKVEERERQDQPFPSTTNRIVEDTHTIHMCRCPWPNFWSLKHTKELSHNMREHHYTCNQLPKCKTGDVCGRIRADTLETYYSCSCPEHHLCVFKGSQTPLITKKLHFHGHAYTAMCLQN